MGKAPAASFFMNEKAYFVFCAHKIEVLASVTLTGNNFRVFGKNNGRTIRGKDGRKE